MKKPQGFLIRLITVMSSIAIVLTFFGNGCGGYKGGQSDFSASNSSSSVSGNQSGVKTLAVLNFSNILKSFDAMIASTTPNNFICSTSASHSAAIMGANGAYTQNVGSLSLDGSVSSINSAMQLGVIKIAAEYCACAADKTNSQSNLFASVNLAGVPTQYTAQVVSTLGQTMSQVFWAGVWDSTYESILMTGINGIIANPPSGATGALISSQVALGACTSMMSSFLAIEM